MTADHHQPCTAFSVCGLPMCCLPPLWVSAQPVLSCHPLERKVQSIRKGQKYTDGIRWDKPTFKQLWENSRHYADHPVPHKDILFILQLASGIGSLFSGILTELEKCFLNEAEILPTSTDIRFHAVCHSPEDMSDLALVSFCFALIDHMLAFI